MPTPTNLPRNPIWPADWPDPNGPIPDRPSLYELLLRAKNNADLKAWLINDPLGTCKQWGVGETTDAMKIWLGKDPGTFTDDELLDYLINALDPANCSGG